MVLSNRHGAKVMECITEKMQGRIRCVAKIICKRTGKKRERFEPRDEIIENNIRDPF